MKRTNIVLISLVLLSALGTAVVVDAAPRSQGILATQEPTTSVQVVPRGEMAHNPPFIYYPTSITLTTSNSTPHVGQIFILSGTFSVSNCSSPGLAALELYRSVNDGEYKLFCTLTTQWDGTFSKNLTYNTAATLKYYATVDPGALYKPSQSNTVTISVIKAS